MSRLKRIFNNTIALSVKILINTIVQLVSTRIALHALGQDDFGLYNLLAGVIVLFSFITGALLISTQRYLSIAIGEGNDNKLKSIFNVSLLIHLLIAVFISSILYISKGPLFSDILNISKESIDVGKDVYSILIISIFTTIISTPYAATLNAHEDMVYYAVTEIIGCILKLAAAVLLLFLTNNLLLNYTLLMLIAVIIPIALKVIRCMRNYHETIISIRHMNNMNLLKEMFGFVGWNMLGSGAVVVRNQGVAVVLNVFFGTAVNAAYGIANQVNSLVLSLASTLTTVFTPSIMESKGAGDNKRMLEIATLSSKTSFLLSSILALPIITFLDKLLILWLVEIPLYTDKFILWIVLSFLVVQLYPGINRAIYASGEIKSYQIVTSIIITLIIPIGCILFQHNFNATMIVVLMFILQVFVLFATIFYAKKECGLDVKRFLIDSVIKPILIFAVTLSLSILLYRQIFDISSWGVIVSVAIITCFLYILIYYRLCYSHSEKNIIISAISKLKK